MSRHKNSVAHPGLALLVILVWSACFVVIKASTGSVPGLFYGAIRALLAAVPLIAVAAATGRLRPPPGSWGWLVALGLSGTFLGFTGMFLSVGAAGAAIPGVLANSQALLVAPCAALWFGETLGLSRAMGLGIGILGVALTVGAGGSRPGDLQGGLLALVATVGVATSSLIIKRIAGRVDVLTATAWQYVFGGIPLLAWALAVEDVSEFAWRPAFIAGLLFLALVGSAGASLLWFWLIERSELIPLTTLTLLVPVFALLLPLLLFRERVGPPGWVGVVGTIAGVVWVGWPRRHTGAEKRNERSGGR
jgi:drug/metabolite transporter (DMT)-like permease